MSLTGCLKKAGDALSTQDRATVLDLAFRKRGEGLKADAAARAALDEMIAGIRDKLGKDAPAKADQKPQEPEPLVTKTGRGLPVPTVESIVKSITKWWKNAPAISVIDTMLDAPKEVFDKYQRETKAAMKAGERLGEVKGFIMPDGRVFIVADAATDARSVVGTVFHEVLGHHGLRGTFGKRIVQILDSVIDMRPADVANKAIEYGMASQYGANGEKLTANAILRGMTKEDRRAAAEEVLAELAEQYPTLKEAGLIRRLIRAIKAWIMENMPNARQFLAMSDEDLIANFIIPARNWIQKGKASRGGAVAFSRAKTEGMATKDVVGNQSGAPADDSMGGDYRGQHTAPSHDSGAPAHDLTGNGIYPQDVYSTNGLRYYGTGDDNLDRAAYRVVQSLKDKPNATVTIYRAVPSGVTRGISDGDWVTTVQEYAKQHGESALDGDYKIVSKKVKASEIFTAGDSWLEWGYSPKSNESPTPDSSGVAFSKKLPATIEVDGKQRPTINSNGQPIHPTEEGNLTGADAVPPRQSTVPEGRMNGVASDAETLANLLKSQTFTLKGFGGLDAPSQREVLHSVLALGNDLKVLRSVIDFIPVDVVDILAREKLSAKSLFRDESVLKKFLSVDGNGSVSTAIDVANALVAAVASVRAKHSRLDVVFSPKENGVASGTNDLNGASDSLHDKQKAVNKNSIVSNSETGNTGQFSPDNADIRFSRAKPVTYTTYRGVSTEGPNDYGVAGKGEYSSGRRQVAEVYAGKDGKVESRTVTLNNPLSLTYAELRDLQTNLYGKPLTGFEKDLSDKFDAWLRSQGHDGVVLFDPEISKTVPEEIVRLVNNADIRYQRTATNPRNLAVEPTARDKIKAAFATPEKPQLSPKIGALDTPLRVAMEKTKALNVWRAAFNLTEMLGGYAATRIAPNLTEHIKAGVIDRYGLDRAVIDQRRATNSAIMGGARTTMRILDKMGALTRAESAVLYRAATTADAAEVEALTKDLRPDSRDALTEIKRLMRDLGAEQVRLGNLDPDTFKRNEWSYLHRTYQKYETEQANDKAASAARALRIKGDQYKTRGLVDAVTAAQLADWLPEPWQAKLKGDKVSTDMRGEKFIRLEAREKTKPIDGEPTLGRLKDVAYWPANEPIPDRFKGYTQDVSTWELRDVRDGKAMMWRDFTEAERTRMGEIDDIRYALVRTMQLAVQDVETGKYFEWLAANYGKELEQLPDGAVPMTDEDRLKAKLATFPKDSWVKVPDGKVQGTDVRKYGQLAGKYVPGPVWNDIRNMGDESFFTSPIGKAFDSLQNKWKLSKTAMSPAVHVNNVMSNFVFMNWADVQSTQLLEAVKTVATMGKNDDAKALWESFKTHGGDSGAYAFHELQQGELESLLKSLEAETLKQNNLNGLLNLSAALDLWREGEKRQAIAALGKSKTAQAPKALIDAMIKVYGSEDTIFRLAAFIKAKADGMTDEQAGKFAQDSFLDYSINAPWIQALRKTALPFIAFSYRAIPKLYDTAKNKPWKLMSLFIAMQALNMLGYSGSGGDEDKERKLLAKEKRGNVWGYGPVGVPKMIRMPWNDDHGSPVFLDIRRWIPVGDVADIEQSHGALPMPQWASIGGIPALFAEFFLNTQGFTGKKITLDTDTPTEKAIKTGDWAYKALMPNIPLPSVGSMARALGMDLDPGQIETYAATGILNAGNGVTDPFGRELSLSQALMNAVGVKVGAYPEDAAMQQIKMESDAQKREIMGNINRYGRQLNRNGIDQETFDRRRDANVEKLRKLSEERQGRM